MFCEGCLDKEVEETQEHIFSCSSLSSGDVVTQEIKYSNLFTENVFLQSQICEILKERISRRNNLINLRKSPEVSLGPSDPHWSPLLTCI